VIVVFGSLNVDIAARVEAMPRRGETVPGRDLAVGPGGKGANQALAARRAGAQVAMAGAVGRDAFAEVALAPLRAAGVDVSRVEAVEAPTGTALIHVDASGDNAITVAAGANGRASAKRVPDELVAAASLVVLQLETPPEESLALARRARRLGGRAMLNAAPVLPLSSGWLDALDLLVVNAIEAAALAPAFGAPSPHEAFAVHLARRHGVAVVVTLGAQGACAAAEGAIHRVPSLPVEVVDTVGAGDAFAGALAAALDREDPLRRALACAAAAGALACTGRGAQVSLPDAASIARHAGPLESAIVTERFAP
jgi:ribokinase